MTLQNGMQSTGYPDNVEDKSWVRAVNMIISPNRDGVMNENGELLTSSLLDEGYVNIGHIVYDGGVILFEQAIKQYGAVGGIPTIVANTYFRVVSVTNDFGRSTVFRTNEIFYDYNNPDFTLIEGTLSYNRIGERILSWFGGIIKEGFIDHGRPRKFILDDRNFIIVNIDNLPFKLKTDTVSGNTYYNVIHDTVGYEYLMLFQHPILTVPQVTGIDVLPVGGNLKVGVYYIAVQYKYNDGDYTNNLGFSQPITVRAGGLLEVLDDVSGTDIGKNSGKALRASYAYLDLRFSSFRFVVYYKGKDETKAYVTEDTVLAGLTISVIISGSNLTSISLDEATIDSIYINTINDIVSFEDRLLVGGVTYNKNIDLQLAAMDVRSKWHYDKYISMDATKGSYADERMIFSAKGLMPNEVYAFYVAGIYLDGTLTEAATIPGILPTGDEIAVNTDPNLPVGSMRFQHNYYGSSELLTDIHHFDGGTPAGNCSPWMNVTEKYPNDPVRFGARANTPVCHHKLPPIQYLSLSTDETVDVSNANYYSSGAAAIPGAGTLLGTVNVNSPIEASRSIYWWRTDGGIGSYYDYNRGMGTTSMVATAVMTGSTKLIDMSNVYRGAENMSFDWWSYGGGSNADDDETCGSQNRDEKFLFAVKATDTINVHVSVTPSPAFWIAYRERTVSGDAVAPKTYTKMILYKAVSDNNTIGFTECEVIESRYVSKDTGYGKTGSGMEVDGMAGMELDVSLEAGESLILHVSGGYRNESYSDGIRECYGNEWFVSSSEDGNSMVDSLADITAVLTTISASNEFNAGVTFTRALAISFDAITLPTETMDKLQGFRFFYAKRDTGDITTLGEVMVTNYDRTLDASSPNPAVLVANSFSLSHFDLFTNGKKHIPFGWITGLESNAKPSYIKRDIALPVYSDPTQGGTYKVITSNAFRLQGSTVYEPSCANENEHIRCKVDAAFAYTYSANLCEMHIDRRDVFATFHSNTLAQLSKDAIIATLPTTISGSTTTVDIGLIHYGGDTFIGMEGQFITYMDGGTAKYTKSYIPVHRMHNICLRDSDDIKQLYYPHNTVLGNMDLATDMGFSTNVARLYSSYAYDLVFSSVLDLKSPLIRIPSSIPLDSNMYRIHRSPIQNENVAAIQLRDFRPASYYDIDKDKGIIFALVRYNKKLIIHTKNTTYVATIKDTLNTNDVIDTYLGKGDLFDRDPIELLDTELGQYGNDVFTSNLTTPRGHVFVDTTKGAIYLMTDDKIIDIAKIGNFIDFHETISNVHKTHIMQGMALVVGYDEYNDRLLVTIGYADGKPTALQTYITASFDLTSNTWISYHTSSPNSYIQMRNKLIVVNTHTEPNVHGIEYLGSVYSEIGKGKKGTYNPIDWTLENRIDSFIDITIRNDKQLNKLIDTLAFITKYTDSDGVYLYNKTITAIQVFNDTQCTELLDVNSNVEWFDTKTGREADGAWLFNRIRDAVITNTEPFMENDGTIIAANVNIDAKSWFNKSTITGNFVTVRMVIGNADNAEVVIKELFMNGRVNNL